MKKVIKTMMMMLVASALVLTSCKDDEEVKDVELTIVPAATAGTHFVGEKINLTINGKGNSDNKLKSLIITKAVTGLATQTIYKKDDLSGTDYIHNFKDSLYIADTAGVTYTFTLAGEKGNASVVTYVATVMEKGLLQELDIPVSLKGQTNPNSPIHFMVLTHPFNQYGTSLSQEELASIDLAFYFGNTNLFTISSPSDNVMQGLYSGLAPFWPQAKTTGFFKVPAGALNYESIKAGQIDVPIINYAMGKTYTNTITKCVPGDLILFKTEEGKLGLLRVDATNPSSSPATNNASMDVVALVQE